MYSDHLSATPQSFGFNYGLLVVDETRDGNGSSIGPDDATVDSFYDAALQPIDYDQWDVAAQGMPPLYILGNYQGVLWHADDFSSNLLIDDSQTLSGYILGGGKVILSGWKTASALNGTFFQRFGGGAVPVYDNAAALIGATSASYPILWVDSSKMLPAWNGMLPYTYTFQGVGNSLYTANMTAGAQGYGLCAMFRQDQQPGDGTLVMAGFPLYFMQPEGVRSFLQQIIREILPNVPNSDAALPALTASLTAYPNPFNPSTTVSYYLPEAGPTQLDLYNLKGQRVKSIMRAEQSAGSHQITLSATDDQGRDLASGVYLLRLKGRGTSLKRVITLVK